MQEPDPNNKQEKDNYKLFVTGYTVVFIVAIIFIVFFIAASYFIYYSYYYELQKVSTLLAIYGIYICCYVAGWILSFPLRVFLYCIYKKRDLIKQSFLPWTIDWLKVLAINVLIIMPLVSLGAFLVFNSLNNLLMVLITIFVFAFVIRILKLVLIILLIHGYYRLNSGSKYEYWKNILQKEQLKEYPIFIITIENKFSLANAYAMGSKSFGLVYVTDILFNHLDEKQFASIMSHETAHLKNNDIIIRLVFIIIFILIYFGLFFSFDYLLMDDLAMILSFMMIILIALFYVFTRTMYKQELRADDFSKLIMEDGKYLAESLEYLYKINKMPREHNKSKLSNGFKIYPSLTERIDRLLNELV